MHVGPWKSLCRVSGATFTSDRARCECNSKACMHVGYHFWQGACTMSGSVNRPSFADSKDSNKIKTNRQPHLVPHLPTRCRKVFTLETLSGAFTEKGWKAFGNMKVYGNNSINESVCSMAKLFCDLLSFGDILTATRRQNGDPPLFFHEISFYLLLLYQHVAGLQIKWKKSSHGLFFKVSLAGNRHLLFPF